MTKRNMKTVRDRQVAVSHRTPKFLLAGLSIITAFVVLIAIWLTLDQPDTDMILPTLVVMEQTSLPTPTSAPRFEVDITGDPVTGNTDSEVTIVMFSDFACTFCRLFGRTIWEELRAEYQDQVQFVYRDFPITNEMSMSAALAAECADDQEEFWAYHDLLYADQADISNEHLYEFADNLELDTTQFTQCLESQNHRDEVLADYIDGQELGLTGAPVFFINGIRLEGAQPLTTLSQIIDNELLSTSP